ncbi:MAG TPA: hypothetical protein ENK80_01125, partial [Rhodobacterales bacterium]|nr:hypothetical protein [Rhodobacterales bacterium]
MSDGLTRIMRDMFPLTPLQEGMFYESTAQDRPWVNLEQIVVSLEGEALDGAAMQRAWQGVADAHAVLRLVIEERAEDHPVQRLHAPAPIPFATLDWSGEADPHQKLDDWLAQDRAAGIDPRTYPAFRVALIRFAPDRGVLVWTLHHVLLDGRSLAEVLDEAFARYDRARAGDGEPDAALGERDEVFAAHCRALASKDHAPGVAFFARHLAGYDGAHRIAEPSAAPGRKGRIEAFLSEAETAAFGDLAAAAEVAPSTVILAAWGIILARATQSGDAVFGMTLAGRHLVEGAEQALGCFINTVPIRLRPGAAQTLGDVLAEARADQIALRPHAHTPLSEIQRASDVPGGRGLFDTIVMFDRAALPAAMAGRGGAW